MFEVSEGWIILLLVFEFKVNDVIVFFEFYIGDWLFG